MPQQVIKQGILETARKVFADEVAAIEAVKNKLDERFEQAVLLLEHCTGRVVITGMGKSGHIGKKMAATFASLGTPSFFLHPAEGLHGDLGMLAKGDVVIGLSKSGESTELIGILPVLKHLGIPLIAMTGKADSTLGRHASVILDIGVDEEACQLNLAPTSSTTVNLVLGDALAITLSTRKGFSSNDFALYHPAGSLGKRLLLTVDSVMHTGESLPIVTPDTLFTDALVEITNKKFGMTIVNDANGQISGIITDGDVRRTLTQHADKIASLRVQDVMSGKPKTIAKTELAATALSIMEQHAITTLIVTSPDGAAEGLLHLHDLLKTGL